MAVIDAREDPAWQTAIAMGAGGQSDMGKAFMSLDKGRPGQDRVRKKRKKAGSGTNANQPKSPILQEMIKLFANKRKKKKKNLAALSTARGPTGMGY